MARIAVGEIDDRLSIWGLSTYGDRTSYLGSFRAEAASFCGLSLRSRNIRGAPPLRPSFHLGMRAMTAVGTKLT
jgi:hypothetical protein